MTLQGQIPSEAGVQVWARPEDSAFHRMWRGFMTARAGIATILMLLLGSLLTLGPSPTVNGWLVTLCGAYVVAALAVRLLMQPSTTSGAFDPQWVATIGVDLLAFATLQFLQAGGLNYWPLFALPVLTASVLGSALLALGTAAGVTLLLLMDAWILALQQPLDYAQRFLQAGLTGTGFFAVALLANELAARLAREEITAWRSQLAARTQAQVNELVIDTLTDGVLVVAEDSTVHAANPSAHALLGLDGRPVTMPFALDAQAAWAPLASIARQTFARGQAQTADLALASVPGERQLVHVRTRMTPMHDPGTENLCVMFIQDLREMEARLRTEKLAAMGRMSAAVAHEIRNPLAAIAQANALLDEELTDPSQRQLSALVGQNAQRLSRIVEEILDITRVHQQLPTAPSWLALDEAVAGICGDWAQHTRCSDRLQLTLQAPAARVVFEPDHLRRVLINLLDNAMRYAGRLPDSISVATCIADGQAELQVWSDGLPLEQSVQRHLFEPFFSSESRSSGLGLYICRELCERHGASIGYRRAAAADGRDGNAFLVQMHTRAPVADDAPFDTIAA